MDYKQAFDFLLRPDIEGEYADHPNDPGGKTRYGVTERVARRHGYSGPMRELPKSLAFDIARTEYWEAMKCDDMPAEIRYPLFDWCYNGGPAAMTLQRLVGATPDGAIGPKTIAAVQAYPDKAALRAKLMAARLNYLTGLNTWHDFGRGWARRLAAILEQ